MNKPSKPVWAERMDVEPDAVALAYCAGRDVRAIPPADLALAPFDIWTNRAHVAMLADAGIIEESAAAAIGGALTDIEREVERGTFELDPNLEDIHMNIERAASERIGDRAGLMHTARSRNDQALTDMRLLLRESILHSCQGTMALIGTLIERARKDAELPVAGLTHTQPGAITSLGHWWASHAFALERDLRAFRALEGFADQSPLGAAASFGSTWPIDRDKAAEYLGFESPQTNSLDCVASRGELEWRYAAALTGLMNRLSSIAQDLILLSSPPRRFITLSDAFVTGSSIMPQKRNPDFCEVTRAKASVAAGALQSLLGIKRAAVAGYNRDDQWTKYLILDLIEETREAPAVFGRAIETLDVDAEAMARDASADFLNAVEVADLLAREREIPFRRAHGLVAEACRVARDHGRLERDSVNELLAREDLAPIDEDEWLSASEPLRILKRRQSGGSPNPGILVKDLDRLAERMANQSEQLLTRRTRIDQARRRCVERLG